MGTILPPGFRSKSKVLSFASTVAFNFDSALYWAGIISLASFSMPLVRIQVENIEALYQEYQAAGIVSPTGTLEPKPWGSKDFGVYDLNNAALVFFEDL